MIPKVLIGVLLNIILINSWEGDNNAELYKEKSGESSAAYPANLGYGAANGRNFWN
jgi:hypothetical protein